MNSADKKSLKYIGLVYLVMIALEAFVIYITPGISHTFTYSCIGFLIGIWLGMFILAWENGKFKLVISNWGRPAEMIAQHAVVYPAKGQEYVYCPIGQINSYSIGDIEHKWCHWCHKFFGEVEK
jgi:hypothetical protein